VIVEQNISTLTRLMDRSGTSTLANRMILYCDAKLLGWLNAMQPITVRTTGMVGPGHLEAMHARSLDGPPSSQQGLSIARPVGALPRLARLRWAAGAFTTSPLFLPSTIVAPLSA
jgi:hypothetical protein